MYKLIVLFAMAVACLAAPRPGLVTYSAPTYQVVGPVAHVPVSYSSQSSSVVHTAPVYSAPLVRAVPVETPYVHAVPVGTPYVHTVPVGTRLIHSVPLTDY